MQVNQNQHGQSIQLFKSYEISYGIMFAEIALLISKCERVFGRTIDLKMKRNYLNLKNTRTVNLSGHGVITVWILHYPGK